MAMVINHVSISNNNVVTDYDIAPTIDLNQQKLASL